MKLSPTNQYQYKKNPHFRTIDYEPETNESFEYDEGDSFNYAGHRYSSVQPTIDHDDEFEKLAARKVGKSPVVNKKNITYQGKQKKGGKDNYYPILTAS